MRINMRHRTGIDTEKNTKTNTRINMRKNRYILAAVMMGLAVTACAPGTDGGAQTGAETEAVSGQETPEMPPEETDGMTDAPEETSGTAENAGSETEKGDTETEAAGAAGSEAEKDEKLNQIHEAVKAAYQDTYIPSMPIDATALSEVFGVKEELCDAFIAEGPMISVHVETFIGIKAKEGKGEEVARALTEYRDSQLKSSMQYPMNIVKLEASQVVEKGDYVFFIMLGSADDGADSEEAALESAKKNNQKAIDVIDGFFQS